jgi:hypothetical protein
MKSIKLSNPRFVRTDDNIRSFKDGRRRVDYHVYIYDGSDGEQYLKGFETKVAEKPNVPQSGTHNTINKVKYQW